MKTPAIAGVFVSGIRLLANAFDGEQQLDFLGCRAEVHLDAEVFQLQVALPSKPAR